MTVEMSLAPVPGEATENSEEEQPSVLDEIADRMSEKYEGKDVTGSPQWKDQVNSEARSGMVRGIQGSVDSVRR